MRKRFLIVGGSYAAAEAAAQARDSGYIDDILIVSEELVPPYHRPPLSKAFMKSDSSNVDPLKGAAFYSSRNIELELGVSVVKVTEDNTAELSNGKHIQFDSLMLAVGARTRKLTCPGAEFSNVHYLKSVEDALALKAAAAGAQNVVVIGGGFIGLEVASTLAQQQKNVTVIEATDRVLARVVSPEVSQFIEAAHIRHGVNLLCGNGVERIEGEHGKATQVILSSGATLAADLIVVGIGSIANTDLAAQLGLEIENGIVVDGHSRTSKPNVYAAGDCAYHKSAFNPYGIRLESVQNAQDQARIAGANVAGVEKLYDALPWFWSDQYSYKLQIAGLSVGATERHAIGDDESLSVFHFKDEICVCIESINRARDHLAARRLLPQGVTKRQLQDFDFDVAALLKQLAS